MASPSITLPALPRPRPTEVAHALEWFRDGPVHRITFHHPGYPLGQDVLLELDGFDHENGGLHVGTALTACGVVAGNRWDGYFTETRLGPPLRLEPDQLLKGRHYFFHLPCPDEVQGPTTTQPYRYPVWPSFRYWLFPHDDLPPLWQAQAASDPPQSAPLGQVSSSNSGLAVIHRDGSCRVSFHRGYVERAHLVPKSEAGWFNANNMSRYSQNDLLATNQITDDVNNAITLRSDIHACFDEKNFVIIPKQSRHTIHFWRSTAELGRLYHNTATELHPNISRPLLFARFAYAIFPHTITFFGNGPARTVCVPTADADSVRAEIQILGMPELQKLLMPTPTPSGSPKKRKASGEDVLAVEESGGRASKRRRSSTGSIGSESNASSTPSEPNHGEDDTGRKNRFMRGPWALQPLWDSDSGLGFDT